VLEKDFPKLEL